MLESNVSVFFGVERCGFNFFVLCALCPLLCKNIQTLKPRCRPSQKLPTQVSLFTK